MEGGRRADREWTDSGRTADGQRTDSGRTTDSGLTADACMHARTHARRKEPNVARRLLGSGLEGLIQLISS